MLIFYVDVLFRLARFKFILIISTPVISVLLIPSQLGSSRRMISIVGFHDSAVVRAPYHAGLLARGGIFRILLS